MSDAPLLLPDEVLHEARAHAPLPVCDHYCGVEKRIRKALAMQREMLDEYGEALFDVTLDCEDGAPAGAEAAHAAMVAELAQEAEDVSISLVTTGAPRPVQVNGKVKIQLKPTDKTQKIWTAEIEIKKISLKKSCKRHQLFMKMDVLGGDLDEPVWVGLPCPVAP